MYCGEGSLHVLDFFLCNCFWSLSMGRGYRARYTSNFDKKSYRLDILKFAMTTALYSKIHHTISEGSQTELFQY